MKKVIWLYFMLGMLSTASIAQTTYYSRTTGFWNSTNSWTLNSDGSGGPAGSIPGRNDNVVILSPHVISVSGIASNGSAGVSPDNVTDPDNNIGPFDGSNVNMFYQTGDITVNSGGTLTFGVSAMLRGNTSINGSMIVQSIVILGIFDVSSGSSIVINGDFILSGNSESTIDIVTLSVDDFFMDHQDALLCGAGSIVLSDPDGDIKSYNGADPDDQVCNGFEITCLDGNCCNEESPLICGCDPGCEDGSFIGSGNFLLPVELSYFTAQCIEGKVLLNWATFSEINNDYFTIERSNNGAQFYEIATVTGVGNSNTLTEYSFTDTSPLSGTSYYRLKQTDFDGQTEYLDVTYVEVTSSNSWSVYPNPFNEQLNISLDFTPSKLLFIQMFNIKGELVLAKTIDPASEVLLNERLGQLPGGIYYLQLFTNETMLSQKIVKE